MRKTFNKGFTLIELLVVIAIIGILATIVLVSLGTARTKGKDAAVQGDLTGIRSQAELASGNGDYTTVCANTNIQNALKGAAANDSSTVQTNAVGGAGKVTCNSSSSAWAAEAPISTGFFCVDSSGLSTTTAASTLTAAGDTACL